MKINPRTALAAAGCALVLIFAGRLSSSLNITIAISGPGGNAVAAEPEKKEPAKPEAAKSGPDNGPPTVELNEKQTGLIKVAPAATRKFVVQKTMVGTIDFNQDLEVQVFTPYQGRIVSLYGNLGDVVKAGQVLYTIDSYDLLQAESMLLQTAGIYELTGKALTRAQKLLPAGGGAQKDLDQAISDQQTAEGNLKAARNALYIFGKTDADIDQIQNNRKVDSILVVKSPVNGMITARNASPGLFVQPGSAPAPYTVTDISTKWMLASVTEADSPALKVGQQVKAQLQAYPGRTFDGKITALGPSIDPATRRQTVRTEIADPDNLLRPNMFANFAITTSAPYDAIALPMSGLVREGDGTYTAWTTKDNRHFTQIIVKVGLEQNGYREIIDGIKQGDLTVTDGAVFISNILNAPPSD